MAEQYTTLGSGNLASNYIAASGSMQFVGGHTFPAGATFSIAFTSAGIVTAIYTVTSVTGGGNTFAVTLENGTDTNQSSGTVAVEVLTKRGLDQIRTDLVGKQIHQFLAANNQGGTPATNFNYASGQVPSPTAFTGTNVNTAYVPFTKATGLNLEFNLSLTKDYVISTSITIDIVWTSVGTSNNVVWGVSPSFVAPGSSIDSAYGSQVTVVSAVNSSANGLVYATITLTGPSSISNQAFFKLTRVIGSGSDTFSGDARLLYVLVTFLRYINN